MDSVRLGITGLGNMDLVHAAQIAAGKVALCELAAVCDLDEAKLQKFDARLRSADAGVLLSCGLVDAVLIATLKAGPHVLVEKPVAVHKAGALSDGAAPGRRGSQVHLRAPSLLAARDHARFNLSTPSL